MKTQEEVEKLKWEWVNDPCWDIEETEGFEEYKEVLLEFRKLHETEREKKWLKAEEQRRKNRPAFPTVTEKYDYDGNYLGLQEGESGMALRDFFAGQALNKLAYPTRPKEDFCLDMGICNNDLGMNAKEVIAWTAKVCYAYADAMLLEREKE